MLLNSKQFKQEVLAILNRIYHSVTHDEDLIKLKFFVISTKHVPLVLVLAYFVAFVVFSFSFFFFFFFNPLRSGNDNTRLTFKTRFVLRSLACHRRYEEILRKARRKKDGFLSSILIGF